MITISNESLRVEISETGGELVSLQNRAGREYLWQGDPRYWTGHAPHLFPFVGRLTGGKYLLDGREYEMGTHGFFRRTGLLVQEQCRDAVTLSLRADDKTRAIYPRDFIGEVTYRLTANRVAIAFRVENLDQRPMYFGYGGHPGFFVPFEDGLAFEDYLLDFGTVCQPVAVGMSDACFVQGPEQPFPLQEGRYLPLTHQLFDRDAVILRQVPHAVTLRSRRGQGGITVHYPGMDYLALWHKPRCPAPYLCIEPWTSIPSRQDVVEELSQKPDLLRLLPGERYENLWDITLME